MAAIVILGSGLPVYAWGPEGHRMVARIAESQLTDQAKARVAEILGPGESLASISSWADQMRNSRPETGPWHYIDIPIEHKHADMAKDCPKGECVVAKIEQCRLALEDPATTPEKRKEALMLVVHFVGDMHQPLHSSDRHDHGGNEVKVIYHDRPANLHMLWDGLLLFRMGKEDDLLAAWTAVAAEHRKEWAKGSVKQWAEQAHAVARQVVYGMLPAGAGGKEPVTIDAAYEEAAAPVIAEQIEKAGARLAAVLNGALR